jgi:hypothetical protein
MTFTTKLCWNFLYDFLFKHHNSNPQTSYGQPKYYKGITKKNNVQHQIVGARLHSLYYSLVIPRCFHTQTLSHNSDYTSPCTGFKFTTLMVIGTDCTGSCKSNYQTATMTPLLSYKILFEIILMFIYNYRSITRAQIFSCGWTSC